MSTNRKDNLNDIIKRQEAILSSLKDEAQSIDNDSIIKQNESLSSEVKEIKEKNSVLSKENEQLKVTFQIREVLFSESLQMKN